jgi:hypothetical protein
MSFSFPYFLCATYCTTDRRLGSPVGAEGELFVSDDQNGNVYRVIYVGE